MSLPLTAPLRTAFMSTLGAFVLCAILGAPSRASAQAVPMSVEVISAISEDVIHGTVEKQRQEMINSVPLTISSIRVAERLKGTSTAADGKPESVDVVSVGGTTDYYGVKSSATVSLKPGEEVVLFLSNPGRRRLNTTGPTTVNPESPMVKYPQVVGSFQGKFSVVRTQATQQVGGQTTTHEVVSVTRPTPGRRQGSVETLPTLDVFKQQVRTLVSGNVPTQTTTLRLSPGADPLVVASPDPAMTALRYFDPPAAGSQPRATVIGQIQNGQFVPSAEGPAPSGS